jgi:serine protease AprX
MPHSKAHGGAEKLSLSSSSRIRGGAVAALLAVAVPLAGASVAQATPNAAAKLASMAKKAPKRQVIALVQFKPGLKESKARKIVRRHHGRVTDRLPSIQGFAVKIPARQAKSLRAEKRVRNVTLNTKVKTTSTGTETAGGLATTFPATVGATALQAAGLTGKGVGVAVIDSGIDGDLPDFKAADGSSRVTNVISNPGATRAGDEVGHGTHVAGIIAGNSNNRADGLKGAHMGIAPDADLVAIKTADDQGRSTVLDVINALQFVVEHKDDLNIQVVNLSVSSDTPDSYKTDPLDAAVEFAWHSGVVVVAAVGNRGDAADAVNYAPGNDPFVISVGATDENGTANPSDDVVADFSSRGVTQDGLNKPDVLAPGAHIVSLAAPGGMFSAECPVCIMDGDYFKMGGTSMASPVVAGAAALILQAHPDLNPDQVKQIIVANTNGTADHANELDITKAINADPGRGANQGVAQNQTVADALAAAGLDPTRATWTKATWTTATWTKASWTSATWTKATWTGGVAAPWAKATWTCDACVGGANGADPTSSTWSKSSWSQSTWSQSTWSQSTWSTSSWSSHKDW